MSEWDKMVAGEAYDPRDAYLTAARTRARELLKKLNESEPSDQGLRAAILSELFGQTGGDLWIEPPFYCDYGTNISCGRAVFFNFNCVVLDVAPVTIGDFFFAGPGVHIYTATHDVDAQARRRDLEYGRSVEIGSDVWIGGGALILPGVRIGARTVVGAGSVVTRDLPGDVFAAGNPCRVVRRLDGG
jgi:maltose O-acetyltransferase